MKNYKKEWENKNYNNNCCIKIIEKSILYKLFIFCLSFILIIKSFYNGYKKSLIEINKINKEYFINDSFCVLDIEKTTEIRNNFSLYFNFCQNEINLDTIYFNKSESPKISVVIPVYNGQNFLLKTLKSIQNQSMRDIEIIFIDDKSTDNSISLIKEEAKKDKRIIIKENQKNMGILYSRREGVLLSKSEYICFMDQDDLIVNDILNNSYKIAVEKDIDILTFQAATRIKQKNRNARTIRKMYQKHKDSLKQFFRKLKWDPYLWGRLIKRNTLINAYKKIKEDAFHHEIIYHEDGILIDYIFSSAKSYLEINNLGYINLDHKNRTIFKMWENYLKLFNDTFYISLSLYDSNIGNKEDLNYAAELSMRLITFFTKIYKKKIKEEYYINLALKVIEKYGNNNDIDKYFKNILINKINSIIK